MVEITTTVSFEPTPMQLAFAFWMMDSEQQTDFFAALEGIAGHRLCLQMAHVVRDIAKRSERGDYAAMHGFQTMLSHAQGYAESATDMRVYDARAQLAIAAREATP